MSELLPASFMLFYRNRHLLVYVVGALLYLWLAGVYRVEAWFPAQEDDGLYLRQAGNLAAGKWLGSFDNRTLVKGVGYPAFVAVTYKLGLPLLFSQNMLYAVSVAVLYLALRKLIGASWTLSVIFLVLLFNPAAWSMQRVIRDHFYASVTLLVLACAIGTLVHRREALWKLAGWAAGLGTALAAFRHTRDEGVWILPALLVISIFTCVDIFSVCRSDRWRRVVLIAAALLVPTLCGLTIAALNYYRYGVFITTEFSDKPFLAAYGATSRVKHQHWQPFVPVPAETRERLYQVSPAFAELRPFLEGGGRVWMGHHCIPNHHLCGKDYFGGWYMWVLRDALAHAGYYRSAPQARAYYWRLAEEINQACGSGGLDCLPPRNTLAPPMRGEHIPLILDSVKRTVRYVMNLDLPEPLDAPQKRSHCVPNGSLSRPVPLRGDIYPCVEGYAPVVVNGWAYSSASELSFEVRRARENAVVSQFSVERAASPDVAAFATKIGRYSPNAGNARFSVKIDSNADRVLILKDQQGPVATVDIASGKITGQVERVVMNIDAISGGTIANAQSAPPPSLRLRALSLLMAGYRKVFGWLAFGALVALAALLWAALRSVSLRPLCAVVLAALIAVITRIALIALINATSFEAIYYYYLAPVYPLLIFFCLITPYALLRHYGVDGPHVLRRLLGVGRQVEKVEL